MYTFHHGKMRWEGGGVGWGNLTEMEHKIKRLGKLVVNEISGNIQKNQKDDLAYRSSTETLMARLASTFQHLATFDQQSCFLPSPPHLLVFQSDLMHYQMQI